MYDVVGSLCENCDKFAVDRNLPKIDMGDYLVIHDTGAHGFSMGYNYNGRLRSAELLLKEDKSVQLIRRAETPKDYFATFDCFDDIKDRRVINNYYQPSKNPIEFIFNGIFYAMTNKNRLWHTLRKEKSITEYQKRIFIKMIYE